LEKDFPEGCFLSHRAGATPGGVQGGVEVAIGNRIESLARGASLATLATALAVASPAVAQDQQTPEQAAAAHDAYLKNVLKGSLTPAPDYLPYLPLPPTPEHLCAADKDRLLDSAQINLERVLQNLGAARLYARDAVASGTLRPDEAEREIGSKQRDVDSIYDLIDSLEKLPLAPDCTGNEQQQQQQQTGQTPVTATLVPTQPSPPVPPPPTESELFAAANDARDIANAVLEAREKCDRAEVARQMRFLYTLKVLAAKGSGRWAEEIARTYDELEQSNGPYLAKYCPPEQPQQPPQVGQTPATGTPAPIPSPPTEGELLAAANDARDIGNAVLEAREKCDRAEVARQMRFLFTLKENAAKGSGRSADEIAKIYDSLAQSNGPYLAKYCSPKQAQQPPPVGQTPAPPVTPVPAPTPTPAPPTEAERARVTREFGQALFLLFEGGRAEVPGTTAGVVRNDADEELPAGSCTGDLDFFGIGGRLAFPAGGTHVFVEGHYTGANSRTCPFSVEPGSAEGAGFSFGQETDNSTGLILGDYAGETGSIRTDQHSISIKAGVEFLNETLPWPLVPSNVSVTMEPFVQYEHRETDFDSHVIMVTNLPNFTPDIGQDRQQAVGEDHYAVGIETDVEVGLSRSVSAHFGATGAVDYVHSSLDSVERNQCDVCTGTLEDFTIETNDSDGDVRLRGEVKAALEIRLAPNATATVGGALDLVPTRGVANPVTGDDVLEGNTTRLGKFEEALRKYLFARVTVGF
jgi:hypothetical protein